MTAGLVAAFSIYKAVSDRKDTGDADSGATGKVVEYADSKRPEDQYEGTALAREDLLEALREEAISYASCHGLVMRTGTGAVTFTHAPCTLLPARLPRAAFESAVRASGLFSTLVDRIARDAKYLEETLRDAARADSFTRKLLGILRESEAQGDAKQNVTLGIFRSDYMLQRADGGRFATARFLQVENNTIAASFGCLSTKVAKMHRFLLERFAKQPEIKRAFGTSGSGERRELPPNNAMDNLAAALSAAVDAYRATRGEDLPVDSDVVVLMLVQPGEANSADQRMIEYALWSRFGVRMLRCTLGEVAVAAATGAAGREGDILRIKGYEVGLVYFRAGYTPRDFAGEKEWGAYRHIELSRAVKCPCIGYHLAGTKKVQQRLAQPDQVEKFLDAKEAKILRSFFADQHALEGDSEAVQRAVRLGVEQPDKFVLKPQREGGGNNLWGPEIRDALQKMTPKERGAFILMRRIEQEPFDAAVMRDGQVTVGACEKEVGVYAAFIGGSKKPYSKPVGHLMRTKLVGTLEGGVASGYAVLDSPMLVG